MKLHSLGSARRGAAPPEAASAREGTVRTSGRRETNAHTVSHATPMAPVKRNAPRHPQARKTGVMIRGVTMAPREPPL